MQRNYDRGNNNGKNPVRYSCCNVKEPENVNEALICDEGEKLRSAMEVEIDSLKMALGHNKNY